MYYELRSYDINPDRIDEYLVWASTKAVPFFKSRGMRVIGFWKAVDTAEAEFPPSGPASTTNVHGMIAWESEAEMRSKWAEVRASDEMKEIMKERIDPETGGQKWHRVVRSALLAPTEASPLQ